MAPDLFCIKDQFYLTASAIDSMYFKDKVIIIPDMYVIQANNVTLFAGTVVLLLTVTLGT